MPHRVHSRLDLPLASLVDRFLESTREEDPRLFKQLSALHEEGARSLAGVLGRFDRDGAAALDPVRRLEARRVLLRLRRPTAGTLALLNRVLDYVDVDGNSYLEPHEIRLFLKLCRAFEKAESANDTLTAYELGLMYQFLRAADRDHDGRLSPEERRHLDDELRAWNLQAREAAPLPAH